MQRQEPKLETHEDACAFVMDIFRNMGGTVIPGKRPLHIPRYTPLTGARDSFYMDFENEILENQWDNRIREHPQGPKRYEDHEWAELIKRNVYPYNSSIDWEEYTEWVQNGGGDEWFQCVCCP